MQSTSARKSKGVNRQYFKHLMEDRELSQRQMAKRMGIDQSSLVRAFQGQRAFKTEETVQLAKLLNVPWEDVLKNLDIEAPPARAGKGGTVAVAGSVQLGVVRFGVVSGKRRVDSPPGEVADDLQALRLMDPGPFEGAYVYYRPRSDVRPDAIGKLCVCVPTGGEARVATPRADKAGTYTLRDLLGQLVVEGVWLESAAPVVWVNMG